MRLLTGHRRQCFIYSAAMCLDEEPATLIQELGHDGSKGVHHQEIQNLAMSRNKIFGWIELDPKLGYDEQSAKSVYDSQTASTRFTNILIYRIGILVYKDHAVAWDGITIFDPNGLTMDLESTQYGKIREFWLLANLI